MSGGRPQLVATQRRRNPGVLIRRWELDDIPGLVECQKAAYSDLPEELHFDASIHAQELDAFPEGQFLAELDGRIVGYNTSIIFQPDESLPRLTWEAITGDGSFSTHRPDGDTLYAADIAVDPRYRRRGIARLLRNQAKTLMPRYRLKRMLAHGRIPGFHLYADKMSARDYVRRVQRGELSDAALNVHLRAGYRVLDVLVDSVVDPPSNHCSTLVEIRNPRYIAPQRRPASTRRRNAKV